MTTKPCNLRLGSNMKHALDFISRCPSWHTFANDKATREAITRLERKGLVETNQFNMFRKVK